jgi:hypothetical protein
MSSIGFAILSTAFFIWLINYYMKCNSWYFGYACVLAQGIGMGFIIIDYLNNGDSVMRL